MATTQAVPRVRPSLRVSFRTRLLALVALIAVAATVLALGLSNSSSGSPGTQIDHRVVPKTVAPAPHRLIGGRF
jgi:hypothetical protein